MSAADCERKANLIQKSSARSSTKFIEQKLRNRIHESSSVGARPSPAPSNRTHSFLPRWKLCPTSWFCSNGGGPGRPRSDRRAFVYPVRGFCPMSCRVITSSGTETSHLSPHPAQADGRTGKICQPSAPPFALAKHPRLAVADCRHSVMAHSFALVEPFVLALQADDFHAQHLRVRIEWSPFPKCWYPAT